MGKERSNCRQVFHFGFLFKCLFILTWSSCFISIVDTKDCKAISGRRTIDFSPLKWTFEALDDPKYTKENATRYYLSFCEPLNASTSNIPSECANSFVCLVSSKGVIAYGADPQESGITSMFDFQQTMSFFRIVGPMCEPKTNIPKQVIVAMQCGAHLGSPEFFMRNGCNEHLEWKTSAYCEHSPPNTEVPCYLYDWNELKRDLTPLIKPSGGYRVDMYTSVPAFDDLFINVCSDIIPANDTQSCPRGSSACLHVGDKYISIGKPTGPLELTQDGNLKLVYVSDVKSEGCSDKPQTTVHFKCPPRHLNRAPRLVAHSPCHYEILWETEYACPKDHIEGDVKTCTFSQPSDGIHLDLSPLINPNGSYDVLWNNSGKEVRFSLNPCRIVSPACAKNVRSTAVCMKSKEEEVSVGLLKGATLRFVDGHLMLTHASETPCKVQNKSQETVIEFLCDGAAEVGTPVFVREDDCIYYFQWRTKFACITPHPGRTCQVHDGKAVIDLSMLTRSAESDMWQAIAFDSQSKNYVINICGPLPSSLNCGQDSSACIIDKSKNTVIPLGKFVAPPTYFPSADFIQLVYVNGGTCARNQTIKSVIKLQCRQGMTESSPILTEVSSDGCRYDFYWGTAAACVQNVKEGHDCIVYDDTLGLFVDLKPLMKEGGYKVTTDKYIYYLNVCGSLKGTECDGLGDKVAACQVDKSNPKKVWKLGEPSANLTYVNRLLTLNYTGGTPYQDHVPRSTSIVFMCDPSKGPGEPEFLMESKNQYIFRWFTSYMCPSFIANKTSVECFFKDPKSGDEYDLSMLSGGETLSSTTRDGNSDMTSYKFYLNVCRPLKPNAYCDPGTASCVTNMTNGHENPFVTDAGRSLTKLEFMGKGHLVLRYTNGLPCTSFGQRVNYSTVIHFFCYENMTLEESKLSFSKLLGGCEYMFLWMTPAACPLKSTVAEHQCKITDPRTGHTYDLQPLHRKQSIYSVTVGDKTYQLSICGGLITGPCISMKFDSIPSVCEVDKNGNTSTAIGLQKNSALTLQNSILLMQYVGTRLQGSDDIPKVKVIFKCNSTAENPILNFMEKTHNAEYTFQMQTLVACGPKKSLCQFTDYKGNQYDLTPLMRAKGENWKVIDGSADRNGKSLGEFHINFCHPLNDAESYNCQGNDIGGCIITGSGNFSIGRQVETPRVNEDGTLTLSFRDGTPCQANMTRKALFTMACAEEESLVFIDETQLCEYLFYFKTPAACPLQTLHGKGCVVKDPKFGHEFNLSPLAKKESYEIFGGEHSYLLNVCEPLVYPPKNCEGAASCQIKDNDKEFAVNAGLSNGDLRFQNGILQLVYDSGKGKCHGKFNRSTVITFLCDQSTTGILEGPQFLSEDEDCTYMFEWSTSYACPPYDEHKDCMIHDKEGNIYDLSGLSMPFDNYEVMPPEMPGKKFLLNVCRSLVHKPDARCPYKSSSCMVFTNEKHLTLGVQNLGEINSKQKDMLYFKDDTLILRYTSGDKCPGATDTNKQLETVIQFSCDERMIHSEPEFLEMEECTYYFSWATTYACPLKRDDGKTVKKDCMAVNPSNGLHINLNPLKTKNPYTVSGPGSHDYLISICEELKEGPCSKEKGSGICQSEKGDPSRKWNGGMANSVLHYRKGIYFLNYTDGSPCHNNQFRRNTIISFVCNPEGSEYGAPVFISETDNCTYYFEWHTTLACDTSLQRMVCAAEVNDHFVDLSQLTTIEGHYTTVSSINGVASYYINVCGPLSPLVDEHCPAGSSMCMKRRSNSTGLSLGRNEKPPFVDLEGHLNLLYMDGSPCESDPKRNYTARIIFLCDPAADLGQPILTRYYERHCSYVFEWKTSIMCGRSPPGALPSSCKFNDPRSSITFDLSPLRKPDDTPYKIRQKNSLYLLNVCNPVKNCPQSSVCLTNEKGDMEHSFGSASNSSVSYDGSKLRLKSYSEEHCPTSAIGRRSTEIMFLCDRNAGRGEPFLHIPSNCLVVFTWKTDLVCQVSQKGCYIEGHSGEMYSLRQLSSLSHAWNFTDEEGNKYWLNVCGSVPRDIGCDSTAAVCMQKKGSDLVLSLGSFSRQSLLLDGNGSLILNYEKGSQLACAPDDKGEAKVLVTFTCSSRLGLPLLISGPTKGHCVYKFLWKTIAACPIGSDDVMPEKGGILYDQRLKAGLNLTELFSKTFEVKEAEGGNPDRSYIYRINLRASDVNHRKCERAAVCQMKPDGSFYRDIGTIGTHQFVLSGSELQIKLTSLGKPCGKNSNRNVTTIIYLQCSSAAGLGQPIFSHESSDCDYMFMWDTDTVCPKNFFPMKEPSQPSKMSVVHSNKMSSPATDSTATTVTTVIISLLLVGTLAGFLFAKKERRQFIAAKSRKMFSRLHPINFRYRRTLCADDVDECHLVT